MPLDIMTENDSQNTLPRVLKVLYQPQSEGQVNLTSSRKGQNAEKRG